MEQEGLFWKLLITGVLFIIHCFLDSMLYHRRVPNLVKPIYIKLSNFFAFAGMLSILIFIGMWLFEVYSK